jgi:hypothetical protein
MPHRLARLGLKRCGHGGLLRLVYEFDLIRYRVLIETQGGTPAGGVAHRHGFDECLSAEGSELRGGHELAARHCHPPPAMAKRCLRDWTAMMRRWAAVSGGDEVA